MAEGNGPPLFDDLFDGERRRFDTRNTSTGTNTEAMIRTMLTTNGYQVPTTKRNTVIATTWGIEHTPDWLVRDGDRQLIVEVKYQGVTGSIYLKIPAEVARLSDSMSRCPGVYAAAYIVVVSDEGVIPEAFKQSMFRGEYRRVISGAAAIHVVSGDRFASLCNRRKL